MFGKLLLLFTLVPLVELYLLIVIGQAIGALPTVLLVVLTGAIGASLARQQGFSVYRRINAEMNQGHFPANELIDGVLIFASGVTLLTPGIITDALGFLLLFPVTRAPVREFIKRRFRRMNLQGSATTVHTEYRVGPNSEE